MSYLTIMPNFYNNNTFSYPQAPFAQTNPFSHPNLLILLSSALNRSLNSYISQYQHPAQNNSQPPAPTPEIIQISDCEKNSIEIDSSHQEKLQEKQHHTVTINQSESKIKVFKNTTAAQSQAKKDPQSSTDDQFVVQEKEIKIKKGISKARKTKPSKQAESTFSVIVPKVDLIDTAYMPPMGLSFGALCAKKQSLLKRRVQSWAQFCKPRKDKRQIRMLNN